MHTEENSVPPPAGHADALASELVGEADVGETSRSLYLTDASIHQVRPSGVVFSRNRTDARRVVDFAREYDAAGAALLVEVGTTEMAAAVADLVAASGASCSQELVDFDVETHHPMELLAEVVA